VIFEGFAPTTAQRLDGLKALRGQVLTLILGACGVCALIRAVLTV